MDDTVCVNLSDLCLETLLRAIMDIRARLTSLVVRHLLPSPSTGFSSKPGPPQLGRRFPMKVGRPRGLNQRARIPVCDSRE
jgi:hypothetical protein